VFSIHSSVILAQCVWLQVSTTMLLLMLLSSMLLLIAHLRLAPVCLRSVLATKAVPRCTITDSENNDALHAQLNNNVLVATTHVADFRCQTSTSLSAVPSTRLSLVHCAV
jgi:hypothetical protein